MQTAQRRCVVLLGALAVIGLATRFTHAGGLEPLDNQPTESPGFVAHDVQRPDPLPDAPAAVVRQLAQAVTARDWGALRPLFAPDIMNSLGGDGGIEEFRHDWRIDDNPTTSPVWAVLSRLLAIGGAHVPGDFEHVVFPYFFKGWPDALNPWEFAVVTGRDTPLRAEPSDGARKLGDLTWTAVRVLAAEAHNWIAIELSDGRRGYLRADQVYPVLGHRLIISNEEGVWKITQLLAGD